VSFEEFVMRNNSTPIYRFSCSENGALKRTTQTSQSD